MEQPKKQDTTTGNGVGRTPILADEKPNTAEKSKPSRKSTSTADASIKPVSLPEALSLLQTLCFDLRSMKCETAILARDNRLYVAISVPTDTGKLSFENGHIRINGVPVSDEKVTK